MDLVIDANVLMSALIATQGSTFDLIFDDRNKLFAPEFLMQEIDKYKEEILRKSDLSKHDFNLFFSLISSRIEFVPKDEFDSCLSKAEEITPDPNDTEYLALALQLRCGVWSNDKKLKEQTRVTVVNTSELLRTT